MQLNFTPKQVGLQIFKFGGLRAKKKKKKKKN